MWASAARNFIRDDTISSFAYMFDLPERAEGPGSDRNGMTLLSDSSKVRLYTPKFLNCARFGEMDLSVLENLECYILQPNRDSSCGTLRNTISPEKCASR
jgi:hypothetical protein